jgi:hypothetical protein
MSSQSFHPLFLAYAAVSTVSQAKAGPLDFNLFQWLFYVDGTIYDSAGFAGAHSDEVDHSFRRDGDHRRSVATQAFSLWKQ